ncbi:hypothetical protein GCM10009613_45580 [Pseudonocardia kongjuensis]|uniref:Uncharacterized protein n=1 Tax=Pseudonocardia kongjuensis TaxID=102227 RepID=A0ABN1Y404_9PSEU
MPGSDAAGTAQQAAADGSGPPVGTPVVTFGPVGAVAELRAVPAAMLGTVPARRGGLDDAGEAVAALLGRTLHGKAVVELG